MGKDPELHKFASGTRRFPATKMTLPEALKAFGKKIPAKPYTCSQVQIDAAKRTRDRIMGERDEG